MSFLAEHKTLIVAGAGGLFVLFYVLRRPGTQAPSPGVVYQSSPSQNSAAQTALVSAQGTASTEVIRANAQQIQAQNQTILAEYLAGTSIADTALQQAGQAETSALAAGSRVTESFNAALGQISANTASIVGEVAQGNAASQTSFGFGIGPVSASASF